MVLDRILREYQRLGWHINTRPYELNLLGVRAATRRSGQFDDELYAFWREGTGRWACFVCPATTDPSTFYLQHPFNGVAASILAEGQYRGAYQLGLHRGKTPAFVQARPVKIIVDDNRDTKLDTKNGRTRTGLFGINIHPRFALDTSSAEIGKASAACQVPQHDADMARLLALGQVHQARYGNRFDYSLLDFRIVRAHTRLGVLAALGGALAAGMAALRPDWVLGKD